MVDLLELGRRQVFVAVLKVRTGIHHVRIEPLCVELVGDVVVVMDRLGVCLSGVVRAAPNPILAKALQRRARRIEYAARGFGHRLGQHAADADDLVDLAFDVDLALDIGATEIEQGRSQEVGQRRCLRNAHGDLRERRSEIIPASVPELHAQRQGSLVADAVHPMLQCLFPEQATPSCG
jgi:hypothetical protein